MSKIKDGQTSSIRNDALRCESIEDVKEIITKYSPLFVDWKRFISNDVLSLYGYSMNKLAKECGFSRNTIQKWCENGDMPRSRKEFIKLGFGLKMDIEDLNDMLQRYGKYPKLYPKNIEDAIYVFSIENNLSFESAVELRADVLEYFSAIGVNESKNYASNASAATGEFHKKISVLNEKEQFLRFIEMHSDIFFKVYDNLIGFIDGYIEKNIKGSLSAENEKDATLNSFLCSKLKDKRKVQSFNNMVAQLRRKKEIPERMRLVAFGIHLSMNLDDIDKMLEMAGMEALCAKDRVECALIYAIESASLDSFDELIVNMRDIIDKIRKDNSLQDRCFKMVENYKRYKNKDDENDDAEDYSTEDILKYVCHTLESLDMYEAKGLLDLLR